MAGRSVIRVEPLRWVHVGRDARRRAHIAAEGGRAWCGREGRSARSHEGRVACTECVRALRVQALDQMSLDWRVVLTNPPVVH